MGLSWYFAQFNRNKRSVVLDLRNAGGREILARLIASARMCWWRISARACSPHGLHRGEPEGVAAGLVTCSINGFGSTGPYRDRPAFDFIAQAHVAAS